MNWYSGSIPDAVAEAKQHDKVFLVYIEGDDDLSKQMTATYNDPDVRKKLAAQNCVALKLSANSHSHQQFGEIYPVLVIPSSFFIGRNGIPLEILTGSLEAKDLCAKIDKVFELHYEEGKAGQSSRSNSPQSDSACPTPAASEDSAVSDKVQLQPENKTPSRVTSSAEETPVASSDCITVVPVGNSPQSPVEDAGQSSSSSQEHSASSSTEGMPSLEQRVERAKTLLEERKMLKEMEEKEKEKKEELERRRSGKALQQAQQSRQDAELKEWALNRAKEKEEERLARERVRAQIAQDRAERAARYQQEKARELESLREKENAAVRAEQERADREAALRSTMAHLQFRLPDGSAVTHQFFADSTLQDARQFVLQEVRPPFGSFTLCTTFPRRHFSENDYAETLRDLQLAPTATLLVLPGAATVSREGSFFSFLIGALLTPFLVIWRVVTSWFRGSNTVGHSSSPPPPRQAHATTDQPGSSAAQPSTSTRSTNENRSPKANKQSSPRSDQGFYRQEGNIFRLRSQQNEDDDNNTWNGNSTQQM